jgi:uncharacterized membrane protein YecN with MAPEG domain
MRFFLSLFIVSVFFVSSIFAEEGIKGASNDKSVQNDTTEKSETTQSFQTKGIIPGKSTDGNEAQDKFAERIQDGTVTLNDVPVMIIFWIEWLLSLAGGIAVIFVMYGGFQYMIGGLTNEKEQGKNTLIYALSGLVVTFLAYIIVDLIQSWYTSGF